MRNPVIGVMGPGLGASKLDLSNARELGKLIAENGWVTLSGGSNNGVMDAVSQGAKEAGGLVIGVLPKKDENSFSTALDVAIVTDMGSARNNINVLSSDVVVACGMGCGTASEVALALKAGKTVVLLGASKKAEEFYAELAPNKIFVAATPESAISCVNEKLVAKEQLC